MNTETVGSRIRRLRKARGLTQEGLAVAANVAVMSIRRYESGEREASKDALCSIAAALGVSTDNLNGYEKERIIIPGRLKILEIDDPESTDFRYDVQAADPEALTLGIQILESAGVSPSTHSPHARIYAALDQLNSKGQSVAVERIEELTKIPDYQRQGVAEQEATEQ